MSRRRSSTLLALAVTLAVLMPTAVSAAPPADHKAEICHFRADAEPDAPLWKLLAIGNRAVEQHELHGDGFPGRAVPGTDGAYTFDDLCNPVPTDSDQDGVPDAVDNCPGVMNPDQSDRYGSEKGDACEDDSDDDGILDVDEGRICISIDGVEIMKIGIRIGCGSTPPATPGGASNIAVAHGFDSEAYAQNGDNNTAVVYWSDSTAVAQNGNNNTAFVDGALSVARAENGDNNTATVIGDMSGAAARNGNSNTATVDGFFSTARAQDGNHNTAIVVGRNSEASATAADGCTVEVSEDFATMACP